MCPLTSCDCYRLFLISFFSFSLLVTFYGQKKFCIWETLNPLTDADSSTDIFVPAGGKKGADCIFFLQTKKICIFQIHRPPYPTLQSWLSSPPSSSLPPPSPPPNGLFSNPPKKNNNNKITTTPRAKKALAKVRSPPQELEASPHSGLYLLDQSKS